LEETAYPPESAAWSPDGKKVYEFAANNVLCYDAISGKRLESLEFAPGFSAGLVIAASIAPNGATCFGAKNCYSGSVKCVDLATKKPRFEIEDSGMMKGAFSPDHQTL